MGFLDSGEKRGMFDGAFVAFGGAVEGEEGRRGLGLRWAGGLGKTGASAGSRYGGRLIGKGSVEGDCPWEKLRTIL